MEHIVAQRVLKTLQIGTPSEGKLGNYQICNCNLYQNHQNQMVFILQTQFRILIHIDMNRQEAAQSRSKLMNYPGLGIMNYDQSVFKSRRQQHNDDHKFLGLRLMSAFASVVISEYLVSYTIGKRLFYNLYEKGSKTEEKKAWVNRQMRHLLKTMIRYNSIVFGTKVLFDNYYSQTIRQNQIYYQSNSLLHYKIGALVGLVTYLATIPLNEFQSIKMFHKSSANFLTGQQPKSRLSAFKLASQQFLSLPAMKRMLHQFNFPSLMGVVLFRTIYFGGYEKIKSKYEGPLNQYVIAPIICSSLSLIVTPIDQIKVLQLTTHKGKSFSEILNQKGLKLWNLSGQKIYTSIAKQSLAMSLFVASQNLCKQATRNRTLME